MQISTAISVSMQPIKRTELLPNWYAIYTKPHHEKKVFEQLNRDKIEAYLPLQTTIRQWSDRRKKVSMPLFSCYLFVRTTVKEYLTVLNVPGVVKYITFEGKAVPIPDKQIALIRNLLEQDMEATEAVEDLPRGTKVEIRGGPLMGVVGELVDHAGKKRVIIRIEDIRRSILVNVPSGFLMLLE